MSVSTLATATTPERLSVVELGLRIRNERVSRGYSLDLLAERSGVSRSMLSAVERGTKAPTVVVLDRIAAGLDLSIERLVEPARSARVVVLRSADQEVERDPSGWERRTVAPLLPGGGELELLRMTIDSGVNAGQFAPHAAGAREYVVVERGSLLLTLDGTPHLLHAGDSVHYDADCDHGFANPADTPCVYYLAMEHSAGRSRRAFRLAHSVEAAAARGPRLIRVAGRQSVPRSTRAPRQPVNQRKLALVSDAP
jgi:transcriptional regulator with XRE-family HTH domain